MVQWLRPRTPNARAAGPGLRTKNPHPSAKKKTKKRVTIKLQQKRGFLEVTVLHSKEFAILI